MLSGNEGSNYLEYKGLYCDVFGIRYSKPKLLEESTSDGVDQVRCEIETFSLLGFQKYIQRLMGSLKIEVMDNYKRPD